MKKKYSCICRFFIYQLLLFAVLATVSCNQHNPDFQLSEKTRNNDDKLVKYAFFNDYRTSDEEMERGLTCFLNSYIGSETDDSDVYSFERIDSKKYDAKDLSEDGVSLFLYRIDNHITGLSDYAVLSNDKRIGEDVLFYSNGTGNETTEDVQNILNVLSEEFFDSLVENTQLKWKSITEEEIEKYEKSRNLEVRDITNADFRDITEGNWVYSDPVYIGNHDYLIKTVWAQNSPYNDAIHAVYGSNYLVGCTAVAIAQVMAYHAWPETCDPGNLDTLKAKWSYAQTWDGTYDWSGMKREKNPSQPSLGALMYEVAEGVHMEYGESASGAFLGPGIDFMEDRGYTWTNTVTLTESIDQKCPVIIAGYSTNSGHSWVLDGYDIKVTEKTRTRIIESEDHKYSYTEHDREEELYVHINLGWPSSTLSLAWVPYGLFGPQVIVDAYQDQETWVGSNIYTNYFAVYTGLKPNKNNN